MHTLLSYIYLNISVCGMLCGRKTTTHSRYHFANSPPITTHNFHHSYKDEYFINVADIHTYIYTPLIKEYINNIEKGYTVRNNFLKTFTFQSTILKK